MEIQQLIKKNPSNKGFQNIYPKAWIEGIKDKLTGIGLDEILASFNMLYLTYVGSREDTRLQIPKFLRRKGLWITYVDYNDKIRTEWYNDNHISDEHWQSDYHWNVALDMSDLLDQYFNSDSFYNIFALAVKNSISNLIDNGEIYKICKQIIENLDINEQVQDTTNNYLNSESFNNTLKETINSTLNQYLENNLDMDEINKMIQDYIESININDVVQEEVNNWINNNQETVINMVKPLIDQQFDALRDELQEWCTQFERVVANSLVRHEQWIQEHST